MMNLGLGLSLTRAGGAGGGATPAHEALKDLAAAAGAEALYDPDNPDTWTLRDDGADLWYSAVADGLGNRETLEQATAANQPKQKTLPNGRRVWTNDGSAKFMLADFASEIAQPFTILLVGSQANTNSQRYIDSDGVATGGRVIMGRGGASNTSLMWAGAWLGTTNTSTDLLIRHGNFDNTSSEYFLNGSSFATGITGSNGMGGVGILSQNAIGAGLNGDLGPIIVFASKKTNAELADIRAHLNNTYPIGTAA